MKLKPGKRDPSISECVLSKLDIEELPSENMLVLVSKVLIL